jgi:LEA14-like dessication related protein
MVNMISLLLVTMLTVACSAMPSGFEAPRLSIVSLTPKHATLFEQQYDVELRIQNPNVSPLTLTGVRFDVELNDRLFARGMSGDTVTVPRFSSETVHARIISTAAGLIRQLQQVRRKGMSKVSYRIKGIAFVEAPGRFTATLDEHGEFDFEPVEVTGTKVPSE